MALIVAVLRLFGVGAPHAPTGDELGATAEVVRQLQAEADVEAYVRANNLRLSPGDSILATCTSQGEATFSCTVMITGDGFGTETMTVRRGWDGRWAPIGP